MSLTKQQVEALGLKALSESIDADESNDAAIGWVFCWPPLEPLRDFWVLTMEVDATGFENDSQTSLKADRHLSRMDFRVNEETFVEEFVNPMVEELEFRLRDAAQNG